MNQIAKNNVRAVLNMLADGCYKTSADHGFHDHVEVERPVAPLASGTVRVLEPRQTFGDSIALAHSELSEALEAYRESGSVAASYGENGKPEGVPSELADVLIRIFDTCKTYGIDIGSAVVEKMEYNKGRSHLHGGKVL